MEPSRDGSPKPDVSSINEEQSPELTQFVEAMEKYKKFSHRQYPGWSEVLQVLRSLGYRKVLPKSKPPSAKKKKS